MAQTRWLKIFSLRYRSPTPVTMTRFLTLIGAIGESVGQDIRDDNGDFIFTAELDGVPCMCAVVLLDRDSITECQFTALTTAAEAPKDTSALDPVHQLIEACFVAS